MTRLVVTLILAALAALPAAAQSPGKPLELPVRYDEDRFYVEPVTKDGKVLLLYTDTGGGLFLFREAADRIGLQPIKVEGEGENALYATKLPEFKPEASIPSPLARGGMLPVFAPPPDSPQAKMFKSDGMLGQDWFGGRIWVFDYPARKLVVHAPGDVTEVKGARHVPLGFKNDDKGNRALNFPRIRITVDGEALDVLFDTGATTFLTDEAVAALKDGRAATRATSFIAANVFDRWRKKHPDWRVIEKAEQGTGSAMIEVPEVTIAGYTVGPVWFTYREDKNFHEFMSRFMDQKVEGAIGGNALRHFRITVDYPNAIASFERAQ